MCCSVWNITRHVKPFLGHVQQSHSVMHVLQRVVVRLQCVAVCCRVLQITKQVTPSSGHSKQSYNLQIHSWSRLRKIEASSSAHSSPDVKFVPHSISLSDTDHDAYIEFEDRKIELSSRVVECKFVTHSTSLMNAVGDSVPRCVYVSFNAHLHNTACIQVFLNRYTHIYITFLR